MRDFNFFSIYVDTKKNSRRKILKAVSSMIVIVVAFGSVFAFYQLKIINLNKQLANLETEITSKERIEGVNKYKETKKKLEILNQYYAAIDDINTKINDISYVKTDFLRELESAFPEDVFIRVMTVTNSEIQMQGISKSRVAIAEFQHNLKEIDRFIDVYVSVINTEHEISKNSIFTVRCTLKDVNKDES